MNQTQLRIFGVHEEDEGDTTSYLLRERERYNNLVSLIRIGKIKLRTFDLNEKDTPSYLWRQWERNNLVVSYLWRQWERNNLVQSHTFDVSEKETISYNPIPLTSMRKKQSRTFDVNEKANSRVWLTWSKKRPWERRQQETPVDSPRYKFRRAIPQTRLNQSSVWHNDSVHMYIAIQHTHCSSPGFCFVFCAGDGFRYLRLDTFFLL